MTRGLLSTSLFHQLNNNRYFVNIFTNIGKKRLSLSSSKSTRICEIYHNHRLRIISTFPFAVKHFIITSPTIVTLLTILYYIILLCQEIPKDNFFRRCIVASYYFYSASRFGKNINSSLCSSNSIFFSFLNSKLHQGCSYKASSENVLRQTI